MTMKMKRRCDALRNGSKQLEKSNMTKETAAAIIIFTSEYIARTRQPGMQEMIQFVSVATRQSMEIIEIVLIKVTECE